MQNLVGPEFQDLSYLQELDPVTMNKRNQFSPLQELKRKKMTKEDLNVALPDLQNLAGSNSNILGQF